MSVFVSFQLRNAVRVSRILIQSAAVTRKFPVLLVRKIRCQNCARFPKTWFSLYAFIQVFSPSKEKEVKKERHVIEDLVVTLNRADDLFNENKYHEVCNVLEPYKDEDNADVLWRVSRALYNLSKQAPNDQERHRLVMQGYRSIERALKIDDKNYAVHKWYAIYLDARASFEGIKARVNELTNVKRHMLRAIELNPADATTLHMLGFWCFNIADMPWYQRQIASTIIATPPTSTYEEALEFFSKAEEADPGFYSQNLLMLGKTYLRLNNIEKARQYLEMAATFPARTDDDNQANKEASELLKTIKK